MLIALALISALADTIRLATWDDQPTWNGTPWEYPLVSVVLLRPAPILTVLTPLGVRLARLASRNRQRYARADRSVR